MVKSLRPIALLAVAATMTACAASGGGFRAAKVKSIDSDEPTPLCSGFRLSDGQAQEFLERSNKITAQQMHDNYNYLPCYVKGTVVRVDESEHTCDFTIRAGGIAELSCENGQAYIYACDTCEALLQDN